MKDLEALTHAIVEMEENKTIELTQQLLESKTDALSVFKAYQDAMTEVGKRFEEGVYFIPELVMSGEMMNNALEMITPLLEEKASDENEEKLGKILIATVEGDIHDIGKNIVTTLLSLNGFDVKDLGVDVPVDRIIAEAKDFGADVVGLSGLLTLAFDPMKEVVEKMKAEGLDDKKIIIGGGQMDDQVCQYVGADAWVIDAVSGINLCKKW
ncbi:MAG TPA: cobalamin-dependent protein, partial [Desulfobacteria bacterium]|nr:cobalamin-dependent protein [Desulfobacteria bacterium]